MVLEVLVDRMGDRLRHRAVGLAREAAIEIAPAIELERAHALVALERRDVEDRQRDHGALERARRQRAQHLVDEVGATIFVAVHAAVQPERWPFGFAPYDLHRRLHRPPVGQLADVEEALGCAGCARYGRADLDRLHDFPFQTVRGSSPIWTRISPPGISGALLIASTMPEAGARRSSTSSPCRS